MSAEHDVKSARSHLLTTVASLRQRLTPGELLIDGRELARDRAIKLTATALASKKVRPIAAVGTIALAAAYLFRKPLARALTRALNKEDDHGQSQG